MDIPGYIAPPRYPGPIPLHFIPLHYNSDLLRSAQLMFHSSRDPILLCISSRTIFLQSAPLISPLFSDLLQSANIHSLACITARVPLVPPRLWWWKVTDMSRTRALLYYPFHYSRNSRISPGICNSLHRSISTFPPSPHDRHVAPDRLHPICSHSSRTTGTTFASIRDLLVSAPFHSLSSLNYIPAASFRPSSRRYSTHFWPP